MSFHDEIKKRLGNISSDSALLITNSRVGNIHINVFDSQHPERLSAHAAVECPGPPACTLAPGAVKTVEPGDFGAIERIPYRSIIDRSIIERTNRP